MSRIVFMGTPDFAVPSLKKLIATQEVVGVVTQPDRPAGRGRHTRRAAAPQARILGNRFPQKQRSALADDGDHDQRCQAEHQQNDKKFPAQFQIEPEASFHCLASSEKKLLYESQK